MEMQKVLISFIQDRSGSMSTVWAETLNGFKTYIRDMQADQQKDDEVEYLFSLTTFDTQVETPYIGKPIAEVDGDELKNHGPRGTTALYDAVGKTLQKHDDDKNLVFDKAIVVIVTDGEENSSREYSKEAVHAAIDDRIKRGNWSFTYLGTQPETWNEAQSIGVGVGASAVYDAHNAHATYGAMAFASAQGARSASGQTVDFLHANTTPMMRSAVGMKTATDDAGDALPVGGGLSGVPKSVSSRPPSPPHRTPPQTNRKWK
jgi:hypothetical protein